jgi:hypothetical protein
MRLLILLRLMSRVESGHFRLFCLDICVDGGSPLLSLVVECEASQDGESQSGPHLSPSFVLMFPMRY